MKLLLFPPLILLCLSGCSQGNGPLPVPSPEEYSTDQGYLKAENSYALLSFSPRSKTAKEIAGELSNNSSKEAHTPVRIGPFDYFSRKNPEDPFPIFYRRKIGSESEEVALDINRLVLNAPEPQISSFRVSPDNDEIAFSFRASTADHFTLLDYKIGSDKLSVVAKNVSDFDWGDNESLLVVRLDEHDRPAELSLFRRQRVPDAVFFERPLYTEENPAYFLSLERSKSGQYLFVYSESTEGYKVLGVSADNLEELHEYVSIRPGKRHQVFDRHEGLFTSIDRSPWMVPLSDYLRSGDEITQSTDSNEWIETFEQFSAAFVRIGASWRIEILPFSGGLLQIPIGYPQLFPYPNQEYRSAQLRFWGSSPTQPRSILEFDLESRDVRAIESKQSYASNSTPTDSRPLESFTTSGRKVPYSLIRANSAAPSPVVVNVYGAYGAMDSLDFEPEWLSLLKRGVSIAFCHVRGGGFYGESWHNQAVSVSKENSALDLVDCAHDLVQRKLALDGRVSLYARSAGGVAAGGAINIAPELFESVVLDVPFLDVLGSMSNSSLSLTPRELHEWGDPKIDQERAAIMGYSPLSGLHPAKFPNVLVNVSKLDERVPYSEGVRWVQQARRLNRGDSEILLTADLTADHSGPTTAADYNARKAQQLAFLLGNQP